MRWTTEDANRAASDAIEYKKYIKKFITARIGISSFQNGVIAKSIEFDSAIYYTTEATIRYFINQSRVMMFHSSFFKERDKTFHSTLEIINQLGYSAIPETKERIDSQNLPHEINKYEWCSNSGIEYLVHTYTKVDSRMREFEVEGAKFPMKRYFPEITSFSHSYLVDEQMNLSPIFFKNET